MQIITFGSWYKLNKFNWEWKEEPIWTKVLVREHSCLMLNDTNDTDNSKRGFRPEDIKYL